MGWVGTATLWCWRRLLRVPWTARRSKQSVLKEISPEYSLKRLMMTLKLQYFGHLIRRADSLEKTLMLGKIEGRRRREWQRMSWLDGITNLMNMTLSKLQELGNGQGSLACCSPWGRKELDMTEWLNWTGWVTATFHREVIWVKFYKLEWIMYMNANNDSLEKTRVLGKVEGRKRRSQRMKWLDGIINSMGINLGKLWDVVRRREAWHAAVYGGGVVAKSWTCLGDWIVIRNVHEIDSEMLAWKMSIKGDWERRTDQVVIKLEAHGGIFVGFNRKRFIVDNWITSGRMLGWIWHDVFDSQELGE